MSFVVFFSGKIGAGKDLAAQHISKLARADGLRSAEISFSILLRTLLDELRLPRTRENYQRIVQILEDFFPGQIEVAVGKRILESRAELIVFTGIRWRRHRGILCLQPATLVYVEADQRVRYRRLAEQKDKVSQSHTFAEFQALDRSHTESEIESYKPLADLVIENNGDIASFERKLKQFYKKIKPEIERSK